MTKIYLKTFGCQMNEYDSSRMRDLLHTTHGIVPVDTPEQATILMLNTCSIREKAQEKVFSELGRWRILKQKQPSIIIGVTGCVASQEGHAIQKRAPFVDFVLGPQTIHKLPEVINKIRDQRTHVVDVSFPEIEKFDHLPTPSVTGPSAYVAIMEGCNKFCSYCIVPYTRGKEISRPMLDILTEVTALSQQGVREVTLLGQNVNAYKGLTENGTIADLALLITKIAAIEPLKRIRFMTSHPVEFSDDLIQVFATTTKLANHLHLPVQSGSDRILKLMKRNHTIAEFKNKIQRLRTIRKDLAISSDFIVGFPGETEEDFAYTLSLIKELDLDQSFSFIYSKRPGTEAANYPDNVSSETKKLRLAALQNLIQEQTRKLSSKMLGTIQAILVTGKTEKEPNLWFGKTENNRTVYFTAETMQIGDIVNVHITKAVTNNLYGELQQ
jgi:tRNA-2-methylthio-N6-dimethylallyladenosine synthase